MELPSAQYMATVVSVGDRSVMVDSHATQQSVVFDVPEEDRTREGDRFVQKFDDLYLKRVDFEDVRASRRAM